MLVLNNNFLIPKKQNKIERIHEKIHQITYQFDVGTGAMD